VTRKVSDTRQPPGLVAMFGLRQPLVISLDATNMSSTFQNLPDARSAKLSCYVRREGLPTRVRPQQQRGRAETRNPLMFTDTTYHLGRNVHAAVEA
jgi:hypothetical protein